MKTYHCKRAAAPPEIDGRVDEPAWEAAEVVELLGNDGRAGRFRTTARLLWDDDFLYLAFECQDERIYATMTERDDPLWEEEVVEIFANPNGDEIGYVEIEVSPLNTLLDLYVFNRPPRPMRQLFDWDSAGIRHAAWVDGDPLDPASRDRFWSVEMAIPWADFDTAPHLPPRPGDQWRFNLFRIDVWEGKQELYAWSPTLGPSFHVPSKFGVLEWEE